MTTGRRGVLVVAALLAVLATPVVAVLVGVWARGWTLASVVTGSMQPGIPPGAVVVLAPVDPADVGPGTVVGYRDDRTGAVVTHRVVEVLDQPGGRAFITQGDANPRPDGDPVPARALVGEVRWRILGAGKVAEALGSRPVQGALAAVPLGLLALSELVGLRERRLRGRIRELEAEVARLRRRLRALIGAPRPLVARRAGTRP